MESEVDKKNRLRKIIADRLRTDMIGPYNEKEILESKPSDHYLTGILWPKDTKIGAEEDEVLGAGEDSGSNSEGSSGIGHEDISMANMKRPCSMGLSFAVASDSGNPLLDIKVRYGTYKYDEQEVIETTESGSEKKSKKKTWSRKQNEIVINNFHILENSDKKIDTSSSGGSDYVKLFVRTAKWNDKWLITLTLINDASFSESNWKMIAEHTLFQVSMDISSAKGTMLVARPSGKFDGIEELSEEDLSTQLLFRKAREYATGHTCAAEWTIDENTGEIIKISTSWMPEKKVLTTSAQGHKVFEPLFKASKKNEGPLSAEWLYTASKDDLKKALAQLPELYEEWIGLQEKEIPNLEKVYREQALKNIAGCRDVKRRIADGAAHITSDTEKLEAFRLANQAMQKQYEWSHPYDPNNPDSNKLKWRPFQLGFILLAARSVIERDHIDRNIMDVLWFPTGGGKTEAYLALIAFLAFYRRLAHKNNPDEGEGVAAIMRYTLRLLTTQQYSRAAAMILACESIRRKNPSKYGEKPFSIGLWVGNNATPGKFIEAKNNLEKDLDPSPRQILECPACHKKLKWYADPKLRQIAVLCENDDCELGGKEKTLPVFTVDEDIYKVKPTLLIGTIDKFAQIVRKPEVNDLFNISKGYPPDLIIQDELHLISGPIGTIAGIYESAIDRMFTKDGMRPKIIGSTATIKHAREQVKALFNRDTCQFPPMAIDADDSGFAVLMDESSTTGRLYLGITTAGRSAKYVLQGTAASLLQSAKGGYSENKDCDPYWTLVAYFNSLRELGGALVLIQDDVNATIRTIADKRKETRRSINNVEELTSGRTQQEVRDILGKLDITSECPGATDALLASNMLSVGVDVPRLGLMVVNGQPKTNSEYIQATSRIGRGQTAGLVVTVLNNAKVRDRSHFESYVTYHSTLYREVEATSVTPFASRARDKALHAALVALVRHLVPGMLDKPNLTDDAKEHAQQLIDYMTERAKEIDPEEKNVKIELDNRLQMWEDYCPREYWRNLKESLLQDADRAAAKGFDDPYPWPTMNNMRSVEPSVPFQLKEHLNNTKNDDEEDYDD